MKLIVGLGNPGKQYEKTRHNIGFEVIDVLSERFEIPLSQAKFKGIFGAGFVKGEKVILLKPLTYMNLSGEAVGAVMNYYDIELKNLLVIYDELDLPTGRIRLRQKGSAGGHNGMKSIISHTGSQEFKRIRVGISRPQNGMSISDYVLGRFSQEEQLDMQEAVKNAADACESWFDMSFLQVMNKYNQS
ncbi:aminoacyl-tRNA hydrolase [Bacillus sp. B15-48]|uniref:aminoacyl-tRNA hydrolase n=1 Tax=Bacillus sp. B15-48 TaxID=1548601 RepID=UPI00193F8D84|nr:aminoacyl-tRNA hydrolase [Bacillus sp. B15-48]MBM4765311.1 aminoacyl-tRNA hydrolase [Bacillus sp. B15-48]